MINLNNWEIVPDEDLWQDGEINYPAIKDHIYHQVVQQGIWKIVRESDNKINLNKLLKQLKKFAKHVREVEYEQQEANGIDFAVEVIEKGRFPDWIKEEEYTDE